MRSFCFSLSWLNKREEREKVPPKGLGSVIHPNFSQPQPSPDHGNEQAPYTQGGLQI